MKFSIDNHKLGEFLGLYKIDLNKGSHELWGGEKKKDEVLLLEIK